jgi:hypothetical protein
VNIYSPGLTLDPRSCNRLEVKGGKELFPPRAGLEPYVEGLEGRFAQRMVERKKRSEFGRLPPWPQVLHSLGAIVGG